MTTAAAQPRRRQPPDVRREQLLDAAERVLLQRGLAAATMADVAEAASVAKGTVYLYYQSKDELLAGLRARYFERFAATLDDRAASRAATPPTYAARVQRLVAAAYDFALANHELHHLLFHRAGFGEDDAYTRARAAVAELVEEGAAAGEFHLADPVLATDFLLHALHGTLAMAVHRPRSQRRRFVEGVSELARRALGASGG
jgi:TetR/AcrR family transcriptional regulator, transcriptional repressor for nem operon